MVVMERNQISDIRSPKKIKYHADITPPKNQIHLV